MKKLKEFIKAQKEKVRLQDAFITLSTFVVYMLGLITLLGVLTVIFVE